MTPIAVALVAAVFASPAVSEVASSHPMLLREVPRLVDLSEAEPFQVLPMNVETPDDSVSSAMGSVYSEERVTRNDGHGHAIGQVRRCENGQCEERTVVSNLPKSVETGFPAIVMKEPVVADPIVPFARHLRGAMRRIEESFKDQDTLGAIFGGRGRAADGATPSADEFGMHALDGNSTVKSESRSTSTEIVEENGHMVQRATTCVNGKCTTTVTKRSLGKDEGDSKSKGVAKVPDVSAPAKKHLMPF